MLTSKDQQSLLCQWQPPYGIRQEMLCIWPAEPALLIACKQAAPGGYTTLHIDEAVSRSEAT